MHDPIEVHNVVTRQVLGYNMLNPKGTPDYELLFQLHRHINMKIYIDDCYARFIIDRRSTITYFSFLGWNFITWHNNK